MPVRALLISSHPVQYAVPVYRALAERDDISLFVFFRSMEGAESYFDQGYGENVQWDTALLAGYEWDSARIPRTTGALRAFASTLRFVMQRRPDVIGVDAYRSGEALAGIVAALLLRRPWVLSTDQLRDGGESRSPLLRWIPRVTLRMLMKLSSGALCMSGTSAKHFQALGVANAVPFCVCADSAVFATASEETEVRPDDELRVLSVGRLVDWKRIHLIIEAVGQVPSARLRVVGNGPEKESWERLAAQVAPDRIEFVGMRNQTELPNEYTWADVLAIASDSEPFGVVAIEAATCGTPLVADASGGAAQDLVGLHGGGWLVEDPSEWAKTLSLIAQDRSALGGAATRAREAAQVFTPEAVAARTAALLTSIAR